MKQKGKAKKKPGAPITYPDMPSGKPKDMSLSDYIKSVLSICDKRGVSFGDRILRMQATKAAIGDSKAAEFLFDRAYGRPVQNVNVSAPPSQIVIEHSVIGLDDAKVVNE